MCALKRKSWEEKLQNGKMPEIKKADKDFAGVKAGQLMLIPTPQLIDAYIRQIPSGQSADLATMRKDLAAEFHAETTCPLTTGIFLRISAEAAYEQYKKGRPLNEITPFWRAITMDSPTAGKLTFGTTFLQKQRKKEGLA